MINKNFKEYVAYVLDNNTINGGKWSDWDSAYSIFDVYGEPQGEGKELLIKLLDYVIYTNGESLQGCLELVDFMDYGVVFNK